MILLDSYTTSGILYSVQCTMYSRPVRTNFFFRILYTFTYITIMYAMMKKYLQF